MTTPHPADAPYRGRFAQGAHRFAVRVYYEDTDAGGVVYHASYLRFFERARSDLLGAAGIDHLAALARGEGGYVVAEVALRYLRPARLGDALIVVSRVAEIGASSAVIQQTVMRDGEEVATGRVTVVFVGPDGRPRRQPAAWIAALKTIEGA